MSFARSLGVFLNGDAISSPGPQGERITDQSFYAMFNASESDLDVTLPDANYGEQWVRIIDTAEDTVERRFPTSVESTSTS